MLQLGISFPLFRVLLYLATTRAVTKHQKGQYSTSEHQAKCNQVQHLSKVDNVLSKVSTHNKSRKQQS